MFGTFIRYITYAVYTCLYLLAIYSKTFQKFTCPDNYIKGINLTHEIVSYGFSTLHAIVISIGATLYLTRWINFAILEIIFEFSIGYFCADVIYIIRLLILNDILVDNYSTQSILQYCAIILHHLLVIYYEEYYILYPIIPNELQETARIYLCYALLAEYAIVPLNYSWYLINTKQDKSTKFLITGCITVIVYFFSRVVNFTVIYYNLLCDGLISYSFICLPLVIMNYYWFYKLIKKARQALLI
jgi:hypothetical protein